MRSDDGDVLELACPHCGYNVAIIPGNRCPECGGEFDRAELRRRTSAADRPRLWQPLTLIVAVPIAASALLVLGAYGLRSAVLLFAPVCGVVALICCVIAAASASDTLASQFQQRGIGVGLPRRRLAARVIAGAILVQTAILALGVCVAYLISGPWRWPF